MQNTVAFKRNLKEEHFIGLYQIVMEREACLSNEAKVVQYGAVLRYFMKFMQANETYSRSVYFILFQLYKKLGDVYYNESLKEGDKGRCFIALQYYNQAILCARTKEEKVSILQVLRDAYYYLDDEEALLKIETAWVENQEAKDKFGAYMLVAQNLERPRAKALFLSKALDEVMQQEESFYEKYQDTLDVCSQLAVLYELLGEKQNAKRVKTLRENTLKLLN